MLADPARLAVLRETGLLDSGAEEGFDRLTRLASRLLGVPVALVSLVDENRQFFKSCVGLPEPWAGTRQTPLSHSFCQYTVMTGEPLIIEDARLDPVLRDNGAVPDLGVIAYAGIPLITTAGERLGTFCAIDGQPRQWRDEEIATLRDLAAAAATEIELRLSLIRARETARALEQSNRDREEVLDATSDGIYTVDSRGVLRLVNRAAAELLGYEPSEMMGLNAHNLFHHSHLDGTQYPESACPIARAARTGQAVLVTDEVLWRKDGSPLPVSYASSPVWRDGTLVGAVVRFTDVSEHRRATQGLGMLAETGRLLASSLDLDATMRMVAELAVASFAEIAVVDLVEGDAIRRIVASHADDRLVALLDDIRAQSPRPDDGSPQARVMGSGEPLLIEEVSDDWLESVARSDDHHAAVRQLALRSLLIVPLLARKNSVGTLTLLRTTARPAFDERDREVAEELGRRAALAVESARLYDAAREATRARDDLLGVVSHDLRNPLNAIVMASSFLLEVLPPQDREFERKQASVIRRAAERANRLIQDLLDIRRIEGGQLVLDLRSYPVRLLIDEAIDLACASRSARDARIERGTIDATLTASVDRDRVLQALGNLISNAVKFTPSDGRITVGAQRRGERVAIAVADTGAGIAAEHMSKLFDRYWQANRRDRRGVGLGLSIVKGIVDAHGGEIIVTSAPGEGSVFTLSLPCTPPPENEVALPVAREEQPTAGGRRHTGAGAKSPLDAPSPE